MNQGDAGGPKPSEDTVAASSYPAHAMTLLPACALAGPVDEDALAARLRDDVELHALPFFARFPDVDAAIAALVEEDRRTDHGKSYALGNLLARLGRKDEAREYFRVARDSRIAVVNAARHHGISLDD